MKENRLMDAQSITEKIRQVLMLYDPITLSEMKAVRLMNRVDTKYVVPLNVLLDILNEAVKDYRVQSIDGDRMARYTTTYYDTERMEMYIRHHNGCKMREKIRVRTYVDSDLTFLEVKNKNNHGRTDKKRIVVDPEEPLVEEGVDEFLAHTALYTKADLHQQLQNSFRRITLVDRNMTERLTIDLDLSFHNLVNDGRFDLTNVAIIELKRNGHTQSPMASRLLRMRVKPIGFSKYCMGCALTDNHLKQNRFKRRLRIIDKMRKDTEY